MKRTHFQAFRNRTEGLKGGEIVACTAEALIFLWLSIKRIQVPKFTIS